MTEQYGKTYESNGGRKKSGYTIKLTSMFAIAIGIAVALAVTFFNTQIKGEFLNLLIDSSFAVVEEGSEEMNGFLEDIEKSLEFLSKSKEIENVITSANDDTINAMLTKFEDYSKIYDGIENVFLGTKSKKIYIYPYTELPDVYDPTSRPWFQSAIDTGSFIWSEPYYDSETDNMICTLSIPIYVNEEPNGVLAIDLNLTLINEKIMSKGISETGYMMLLDEKGNTVFHPNKDLIGKPLPVDELKEAVTRFDSGVMTYLWENRERVAMYSGVDKLKLKLVGTVYKEELTSRVSIILMRTIALSLVSVILIALIFGLISSKLVGFDYDKGKTDSGLMINSKQKLEHNTNNELKEKLQRLSEYRSEGVITREEYENKRADIIKDFDI